MTKDSEPNGSKHSPNLVCSGLALLSNTANKHAITTSLLYCCAFAREHTTLAIVGGSSHYVQSEVKTEFSKYVGLDGRIILHLYYGHLL
jgi:hypothetical protein